jgi:hypothetical protein
MMRGLALLLVLLLTMAPSSIADEPLSTQPAGKLAHLDVDVKQRRVRVECESLRVEDPLEFFCVMTGTSEHESVLRSRVKPSDLHLALLMIGLEPGAPVSYSEVAKRWLPPHGPPIQIHCEFERDGQTVSVPAYRMMRNLKTREEMPPLTWIFAGSRVMPDGNYAADVVGYLVSIVNFDLTVIDVPKLASSANETLEWETNFDLVPTRGTKVTMIIEPASDVEVPPPSTQPAEDQQHHPEIDALRQQWLDAVRPRGQALRDAAKAHYEVILQLRRRQQELIDEADRLQNLIDELEQQYQNLTSPRPENVGQE